MKIINLKNNSFIIELENRVYIFNDMNMCFFKKNNSYDRKLDFLKYIKQSKSIQEIQEKFNVSDKEIKMFLERFELFIEQKEITKKIALFGKTNLNILLYEKLNRKNLVDLFDEFKDDVKLDKYNLIIVNQNTKFSPLYERINLYCSKKNKTILNILWDSKFFTIGPYLKNDGTDNFCYECFNKRSDVNNINIEERCIKNIISRSEIYDDSQYFYLSRIKEVDKVSEIISEFIDEKRIYDYRGVYIWNERSKKEQELEFVPIYLIPFCKKCDIYEGYLYNEKKRFERADTSSIELSFVNKKYGIFRKFISSKTVLNDERIFYYTIQIPSIFNGINDLWSDTFEYNVAGGVSVDSIQAKGKAIGEAVERYCLEAYKVSDFIFSSVDELEKYGKRVLNSLQLFDEWQYEQKDFPYVKMDNIMKIYWTKAKDIFDDREIYIPASFVYSRFNKFDKKNCIGCLTTSGTAASVDYPSAVLYGIYELIERDSTMITWFQKLEMPKVFIDYEKIKNNRLKESIELLNSNDINIDIYYITLDLEIPCFLAIGTSNNKFLPKKLIGAGCRINKEEALIRALEEIIQGCGWASIYEKNKKFTIEKGYINVNGFRDRVSLYALKEMEKEFDFLRKSEKNINFDSISNFDYSIEEELSMCLRILNNNNMQVIVKDLTTSDIYKIGFTVVKVFIPELQQIEADHRYRYLNCLRTIEVPLKLKYENVKLSSKLYNSAPHPFP